MNEHRLVLNMNNKVSFQIFYIWYMHKDDLVWNNLQKMICDETKLNQTKPGLLFFQLVSNLHQTISISQDYIFVFSTLLSFLCLFFPSFPCLFFLYLFFVFFLFFLLSSHIYSLILFQWFSIFLLLSSLHCLFLCIRVNELGFENISGLKYVDVSLSGE